ncbi:MAG: TonB-dependent receptor plug domain-containing protein, partial [Opitutaceae bacterium]
MSNIPRLLTSRRCYYIAIVGALGAFLPSLHSQSVSTTPTKRIPTPAELTKYDKNANGVLEADEQAAFEAGEKTDAVLLTPFEVSTDKDRGYAAGNTLAGGRVDTPLALTPSSISIMTKEFLDDFAITDSNAALQWSMNADIAGNPTQGPFGGDRFEANVRGAGGQGAGAYPVRDGLQQYWIADSYNSERFETISGPNSAVSGLGGPGGLVGSSSKRGRFNNRSGSFSARVDSFGGYRSTFDYNVGFDRVAFRVNALHQNIKDIQDYTSNKQNGITLAANFKITPKTLLSVQFERSAEWNIQYRRTYGEQASFWNRVTVNADNSALTTTGTGLSQISATNDRLTYNFSTGTLLNYKGNQYQTTGLGYQIPWGGRPDLPQEWQGTRNFKSSMGKTFFLGPIDSIADRDLNAQQAVLEHTFTPNLSARLTWQASDVDPTVPYSQGQPGDYRIDVNRLLPDGVTTNPNYLRAYSDWTPNSQHQTDNLTEYVGQVNYRFALPRLFDLKQRFNLIAGRRFKDIDAWDRRFARNNNPAQPDPLNANNTLTFRQYYGDKPAKQADILNFAAVNKLSPGMTFDNYGTTGYHNFATRGLKY